jgi:hypothetical protein
MWVMEDYIWAFATQACTRKLDILDPIQALVLITEKKVL